MAAKRKGILCVGLACLDIVNSCDHYPIEDSDVRATGQKWSKGGNASNTLCVLTQLDSTVHCELLASLGEGMETKYVCHLFILCSLFYFSYFISKLDLAGVNHTHCRVHPKHRLPTSYVLLNTSSGTRTIVHYRYIYAYTCTCTYVYCMTI